MTDSNSVSVSDRSYLDDTCVCHSMCVCTSIHVHVCVCVCVRAFDYV